MRLCRGRGEIAAPGDGYAPADRLLEGVGRLADQESLAQPREEAGEGTDAAFFGEAAGNPVDRVVAG